MSCECSLCGDDAPERPFPDEITAQQWKVLEQKLLAIGGERVVWYGEEPNLPAIVSRGRLIRQPIEFLGMPLNECHQNAALVWSNDVKGTKIVVGYGLKEGLWRQHSWATKNGTLLETNVVCEKYFGVELNQQASLYYWLGNFFQRQHPRSTDSELIWCLHQHPQVAAVVLKLSS